MPRGVALRLLKYANADEANACCLRAGSKDSPVATALVNRAAVMRAAAEMLVPGITASFAQPPSPADDAPATGDELAGADMAASRALIVR